VRLPTALPQDIRLMWVRSSVPMCLALRCFMGMTTLVSPLVREKPVSSTAHISSGGMSYCTTTLYSRS
jgi:hypothetical protein